MYTQESRMYIAGKHVQSRKGRRKAQVGKKPKKETKVPTKKARVQEAESLRSFQEHPRNPQELSEAGCSFVTSAW